MRLMLINPKRENLNGIDAHNGLALLGTIMRDKGHEVKIVDYMIIQEEIPIHDFIESFKPDMIGVSVYTINKDTCLKKIKEIRACFDGVLIVGGHHPSYKPGDFNNLGIDYIFIGESEESIVELKPKRQEQPKIIYGKQVSDLDKLPIPDYRLFHNWENIYNYPLLTSRGCPYQCSFCISNKKYRARSVHDCIEEIEFARSYMGEKINIIVMDDQPLLDKMRFKEFLRRYAKRFKMKLTIINTRADSIDSEMLDLMKSCNVEAIGIGVEHGNTAIFNTVNKGENLLQIEDACNLIKRKGFTLGLTFIIGLPYDTFEDTKDSIAFYKKVKADYSTWNFVMPFDGSKVKEQLEYLGAKFHPIDDKQPYCDNTFLAGDVTVETDIFTKWEMERAYYMAIFQTTNEKLRLRHLKDIYTTALRYNLFLDFIVWLPKGILKSLKRKTAMAMNAFDYMKKNGIRRLFSRILYLINAKRL